MSFFFGETKIVNAGGDSSDVEWRPLGDGDRGGDGDLRSTCDISSTKMSKGIQILGEFLANLDESSPLADGMHIVSIHVMINGSIYQ